MALTHDDGRLVRPRHSGGRRHLGRAPLLLVPLLLMAAAPEPLSTDVVAQRGTVRLTVADVRDVLGRMDAAERAKLETNPAALAALVRDRLVTQAVLVEARAQGWDQRAEVVRQINDARDAVIVQSYLASVVPADPDFPAESDLAAAYEANKTRFVLPRQYRLAQIVIPVPANAGREQEEDLRRKAADLRLQATKPKADFAELARRMAPPRGSADRGADLGWVREDELQAPVRDAVSGLPEAGVTEPIRLPDGFYIVRLNATKAAGPAPLADVRPQLAQALRQARTQQTIRTYIDAMLRKDPIQLNEIDIARLTSAGR